MLWEAAARGHGAFVVDMTGTQACASAGVSVLAQAHNWALAQGGELRLATSASAPVLRLFAVTGIDQVIPNFAGLDEALQPASAGTASRRAGQRPKPGMLRPAQRQPAGPGASASPA